MYDRTDLEIFTRVVRTGSMTRTAGELDLSVAVVSKRLQRLEQRLSVRLLHRTTRRVVPTDLGATFFDAVAPLVDAILDAETAVSRSSDQPSGTLKVTAPSSFGRLHIVPHLRAFFALYPELRLSLELNDDFERLAESGFDVAVRIGALPDSSLTARRLAPVRRVLCARPDYLDAAGRPKAIGDLARHACLATENQNPWRLVGRDGPAVVNVSGPLRTHSNEVVREAVIGGLGIALRSIWDVHAELTDGGLEIVLPEWTTASETAIHAVYPSRAYVPAKIRVFVEFLRKTYRSSAAWTAAHA